MHGIALSDLLVRVPKPSVVQTLPLWRLRENYSGMLLRPAGFPSFLPEGRGFMEFSYAPSPSVACSFRSITAKPESVGKLIRASQLDFRAAIENTVYVFSPAGTRVTVPANRVCEPQLRTARIRPGVGERGIQDGPD